MPRSTAARASATSAGSTRPTTRGRGVPRRRCSRCRRSRRCGSRSSAEARRSAGATVRGPRPRPRSRARALASVQQGREAPARARPRAGRRRRRARRARAGARAPRACRRRRASGRASSRRSNASSTCPPARSRSATSSCAARSSGAAAAAFADLVERPALQAPEQVHLREAGHGDRRRAGSGRSRCDRRMPRPRSRRARSRRTPPGAAAAAAPRRAPRRAVGGRLLAVGLDAARDAVLRAELEELVEDLLDHVVGLHAGEERHRLAGDRGPRPSGSTAPGTPARAAGCGRRRPWRARAGRRGRATSRSRVATSVLDCSLHSAHSSTTTGTVRESSSVEPNDASSVSKTIRSPPERRARLRRPLLRALHEGGEVDGTAQVAGGSGVGHGTSDAPIRLSDQPRRRICSSEPTLGT